MFHSPYVFVAREGVVSVCMGCIALETSLSRENDGKLSILLISGLGGKQHARAGVSAGGLLGYRNGVF